MVDQNINVLIKTLYERTGIKASIKDLDKLQYSINTNGQVVDAFSKKITESEKAMKQLGKTAQIAARRFKGEWLSTMFFMMAIQRVMTSLGKTVLSEFKRATESTTYWNSAVGRLAINFKIFSIAAGAVLSKVLEPFSKWVQDNSQNILDFIGSDAFAKFVDFGVKALPFVTALSALGIITLGVDGLAKIIGAEGIGGLITFLKANKFIMGATGWGLAALVAFDISKKLINGDMMTFENILTDALGAGIAAGMITMNPGVGVLVGVTTALVLAEMFPEADFYNKIGDLLKKIGEIIIVTFLKLGIDITRILVSAIEAAFTGKTFKEVMKKNKLKFDLQKLEVDFVFGYIEPEEYLKKSMEMKVGDLRKIAEEKALYKYFADTNLELEKTAKGLKLIAEDEALQKYFINTNLELEKTTKGITTLADPTMVDTGTSIKNTIDTQIYPSLNLTNTSIKTNTESVNLFKSVWDSIKSKTVTLTTITKNVSSSIFGGGSTGGKGASGSYQFGGYVPSTGLYKLHAGETVIPNNNIAQTFSPSVTVNGGGLDARAMARMVSDIIMGDIKRYAHTASRYGG